MNHKDVKVAGRWRSNDRSGTRELRDVAVVPLCSHHRNVIELYTFCRLACLRKKNKDERVMAIAVPSASGSVEHIYNSNSSRNSTNSEARPYERHYLRADVSERALAADECHWREWSAQ